MLISTLINQLVKLQEKHGDKEVHIFADIIASKLNLSPNTDIESIEYDEDENDIFLRANF